MAHPHRISRRTFLKRALQGTAGLALASTGSFTYARTVEPGWLDIVQVALPLPQLPAAFAGYRVAHISDIHSDDWMTDERLHEIVTYINDQQPDLVAITGDFITRRQRNLHHRLVEPLRRLTPPDGTLAVLGNHDHWSDASTLRAVLAESGIIELRNRSVSVERNGTALHIGGVDDVWEQHDRLDEVLASLPPTGPALLLAHEPDFADVSAATGRFALQLSGHSHGGQVRLPFLGAPILPYLGEKYPYGLYHVGTMWLYTNPGVGTIRPRLRFNCRPEITVYTLSPAPA